MYCSARKALVIINHLTAYTISSNWHWEAEFKRTEDQKKAI